MLLLPCCVLLCWIWCAGLPELASEEVLLSSDQSELSASVALREC